MMIKSIKAIVIVFITGLFEWLQGLKAIETKPYLHQLRNIKEKGGKKIRGNKNLEAWRYSSPGFFHVGKLSESEQ